MTCSENNRKSRSATVSSEITKILLEWANDDERAFSRLIDLVYEELHLLAKRFLNREPTATTLSPTTLIHEAYLRLSANKSMRFDNRKQFFWFAGQLMRQILVDHARAKLALKRGGQVTKVTLGEIDESNGNQNVDLHTLISLDEALSRLETIDPRQTRIVELRFFAGLKVSEIAELMNLSAATVVRESRTARRWLARELEI